LPLLLFWKKKNSNLYYYFLTNLATTNYRFRSKSIKIINIPLLVQFIYDLYVSVCLWFEGNWFYLSFDKIEFNFVTYVYYNWRNDVLFNGYLLYFVNFIIKLEIWKNLGSKFLWNW
jgi:hypothetical protein